MATRMRPAPPDEARLAPSPAGPRVVHVLPSPSSRAFDEHASANAAQKFKDDVSRVLQDVHIHTDLRGEGADTP